MSRNPNYLLLFVYNMIQKFICVMVYNIISFEEVINSPRNTILAKLLNLLNICILMLSLGLPNFTLESSADIYL